MVVTHMLNIQELELVVPIRDLYRDTTCRTHSFSDNCSNELRLNYWIPKYKPPASCQSLPRLTLNWDSVFVGIRNSGQLGYCMDPSPRHPLTSVNKTPVLFLS